MINNASYSQSKTNFSFSLFLNKFLNILFYLTNVYSIRRFSNKIILIFQEIVLYAGQIIYYNIDNIYINMTFIYILIFN